MVMIPVLRESRSFARPADPARRTRLLRPHCGSRVRRRRTRLQRDVARRARTIQSVTPRLQPPDDRAAL